MTKRFQERWTETRSKPFEHDGELVHSIYRREIEPGTTIEIEFLGGRSDPLQGIEIAVTKGSTLASDEQDVEGRAIRLWRDKQDRASLRYVNPRKGTEVSIWNIWLDTHKRTHSYELDSYDIVQAWWAWSGMRIDESADGVVLRCSGSYDGPNFEDLVVQVTFLSRGS